MAMTKEKRFPLTDTPFDNVWQQLKQLLNPNESKVVISNVEGLRNAVKKVKVAVFSNDQLRFVAKNGPQTSEFSYDFKKRTLVSDNNVSPLNTQECVQQIKELLGLVDKGKATILKQ